MPFVDLYRHVAGLRHRPVIIERDVVPFMLSSTAQDIIEFVPVELDPAISLGHIKQYRHHSSPYDGNPKWISQIRYFSKLNICWRRYVCCKELMHIYDSEMERSNTAEKFITLLREIESPLLPEKATAMFYSENRTKWLALAVLCPIPLRDHFRARWRDELSDYEVALELRVPEGCIPTIMGDDFDAVVNLLTE